MSVTTNSIPVAVDGLDVMNHLQGRVGDVVVYHVNIVAIGHGLLKKFWYFGIEHGQLFWLDIQEGKTGEWVKGKKVPLKSLLRY